MKDIISKIENKNIGIIDWILGFSSIILIRYFFESISSTTNSGVIPSDIFTIMHTWFFFIATIFGLVVIVGLFTKNHKNLINLALFGLPIIWLGPILDVAIGYGKTYKIAYLRKADRESSKTLLHFLVLTLHKVQHTGYV